MTNQFNQQNQQFNQPEQPGQSNQFNQAQQPNFNYSQPASTPNQGTRKGQPSRKTMMIAGIIAFVVILIGGYSWYESQPNVILSKHDYYLVDPDYKDNFEWKADTDSAVKFTFKTNGRMKMWLDSSTSYPAKYKINNGTLKITLDAKDGGTEVLKLKNKIHGTLSGQQYAGYSVSSDDSTDGAWLIYGK